MDAMTNTTSNAEWQRHTPRGADSLGFVYIVVTDAGRWYIGKKQYTSTITLPPLSGKKKKRKVTKESDWGKYHGSSRQLCDDIKRGTSYQKHIVFEGISKSELAYVETKLQLHFDAAILTESYNGILNCRLSKIKVKSTHGEDYQLAIDCIAKILSKT